jgi:hypothetical protein
MADQRDLHDLEQVVPAIFDADIADGHQARGGRSLAPSVEANPAVNKIRSGSSWIWEDARAFVGTNLTNGRISSGLLVTRQLTTADFPEPDFGGAIVGFTCAEPARNSVHRAE